MSVLVTGGTGFLGKNLNKMGCFSNDIYIYIVRKKIDGETILVDDYTFENLEIPDHVDRCLLLGSTTPKGNGNETAEDYFMNVVSINNLLKALNNKNGEKIKKIIFVSSVSVYGRQSVIINESTDYNVTDTYGATKVLCEQLIIDWCHKNKVDYVILRVGNMYGPEEYNYKKIIGTFMKLADNNEDIVLFSDGSEKRNLIFVGDVCKCIRKILNKQDCCGIINLVSSMTYTVREIAEIVINQCKSKSTITCKNKQHGRDDNIYDPSKFISILGGKEKETPLDIGIMKMRKDLN